MNGFDYIRSLSIEKLALFLHNAEDWEHWLRFGEEKIINGQLAGGL